METNPCKVMPTQLALSAGYEIPATASPFSKEELAMLSPDVGNRINAWAESTLASADATARQKILGETLAGAKEPAWVGVMRDITYQLTLVDKDNTRAAKNPVLDQALDKAAALIAPFEK